MEGRQEGDVAEQSTPIKNSTAYHGEEKSSGKHMTKVSEPARAGIPLFNGDLFQDTRE